jgi:hypothetical protein
MITENNRDIRILRELAKKVNEIAGKPVQNERRELWRKHNSLQFTRPLIYVRWIATVWEILGPQLQCEDPFFRQHELTLREKIFQDSTGDDYIIEPWITQRATRITHPEGHWGVRFGRVPSPEPRGAWKFDPPLKKLDDIEKLVVPRHMIDEQDTARNVERLREAVGDILQVNVDRSPAFNADLSYDLANLRGLEQIMWDMLDNPQWLHRLMGFLRDGILAVHEQAERAGDWRLADHENQAMPYSLELPDPRANSEPVPRHRLWCFMLAQEMAQVSPEMHEEFVLRYQMPIMEAFGLVSYGCCEDLTRKIKYLKKIPNLRRIAVTPWADVRSCAEQIGQDYVLSWRPNPAQMVCCGFQPDYIRKTVRDAMEASKGCHVDITLKDIETVQGHPERLAEWARIVRSIADDYA